MIYWYLFILFSFIVANENYNVSTRKTVLSFTTKEENQIHKSENVV